MALSAKIYIATAVFLFGSCVFVAYSETFGEKKYVDTEGYKWFKAIMLIVALLYFTLSAVDTPILVERTSSRYDLGIFAFDEYGQKNLKCLLDNGEYYHFVYVDEEGRPCEGNALKSSTEIVFDDGKPSMMVVERDYETRVLKTQKYDIEITIFLPSSEKDKYDL